MRTGRLSISRGFPQPDEEVHEPRLTLVDRTPAIGRIAEKTESPCHGASEPSGNPPDCRIIGERLEMLERLANLRTQDLLSQEEFVAGKALVLGGWAERTEDRSPAHFPAGAAMRSGPSLAGRMFSWKLVPIGIVGGLALSFGTEPDETVRFFDQALRLVGA